MRDTRHSGIKKITFSVSVFGNPDLVGDSLPVRLVPKLRERFPEICFVMEDPNEIDLPKEGKWVILDTVRGLDEVVWISVEDVAHSRNAGVTAHDYDLSTLLLLGKKLDPSFEPQILGIPFGMNEGEALPAVARKIEKIIEERSF